MSITAAIRRMIDAGLTIEQALIAAEAVEAEMPKQRSAGALRQERYRRNKEAKRLRDAEWYPLMGEVIRRDGGACSYCGSTDRLGADHVIPLSRGGSNDASNLVACCESCNKSKGGRTVEEWRAGSGPRHGDVTSVTNRHSDGGDATPPSPSLPPQTPPTRPHPPVRDTSTREGPSRSEIAAEFAEFWAEVPRKVGRGQAEKAFAAARKHTEHSVVMAGIRRYAAERRLEDPNYTRHPQTWLNGKGWLDEPAPPSTPRNNPNQRGQHEQRHSHVQRGPASVADHLANIVAREQFREPAQPDREGQLRPADRVQDRELSFERGEDGSFGGGGYGAPRLVAARNW